MRDATAGIAAVPWRERLATHIRQHVRLERVSLSALEQIPTRLLHTLDAMTSIMRAWPSPLPSVDEFPPYSVTIHEPTGYGYGATVHLPRALRERYVLPPIVLTNRGGAFALADGNHRLTTARALGIPALYAVVYDDERLGGPLHTDLDCDQLNPGWSFLQARAVVLGEPYDLQREIRERNERHAERFAALPFVVVVD